MEFRLLLITALIMGTFLAGLIVQNGEVLILAIPLLIYLGTAWLSSPEAVQIEAARQLSRDRVGHDTEIDVLLKIFNRGRKIEAVEVLDQVPLGLQVTEGDTSLLCALGPGQETSLQYKTQGPRGHYRFGGVQVIATDHFGIFRKSTFLPIFSNLSVLPQVRKLKKVEIRPRYTRIYSGLIPARIGGPGVEFHGVRPFQPGDPLRWINNRASARRPDGLYINEFVQERVADVGLILDARTVSNMPGPESSLLDYSIDAACSLADYLLDNGNRVGMLIYGGPIRWTFPRFGRLQKERILQALAAAELGSNPIFEDLAYIPTRLFPANSQLIVLSPLLEEDLPVLMRLRARGYAVVVVSPQPIDYERKLLGGTQHLEVASKIALVERQFLLKRLRHGGIVVADWKLDKPFHHVAHHVLSRTQLAARIPEMRLG